MDNLQTTTDTNAKKRKKIEDALMSFLFGLCQPDKGEMFGFIDDFKSEISSHILQAMGEFEDSKPTYSADQKKMD